MAGAYPGACDDCATPPCNVAGVCRYSVDGESALASDCVTNYAVNVTLSALIPTSTYCFIPDGAPGCNPNSISQCEAVLIVPEPAVAFFAPTCLPDGRCAYSVGAQAPGNNASLCATGLLTASGLCAVSRRHACLCGRCGVAAHSARLLRVSQGGCLTARHALHVQRPLAGVCDPNATLAASLCGIFQPGGVQSTCE